MSYPGRSTLITLVACVAAVGGAAVYAYGGFIDKQTAASSDKIAVSEPYPTGNATGTNIDWRAQFADATTSQYAVAPTAQVSSGPSTITESLGMDFLSRFADLKQANLVGNTDVVNQAVGNMLSTDLDPIKPKTYSATDLNVNVSSDPASLAAFGTAVARLIDSYAATTSEFAIIQQFMSSNDPSVLASLDKAISEQKRILASILSVPVPQPLLKDDIDLANGMSTLEAGSESLRVADVDSVRSLVGTSLHANGAQEITDALSAIHETLASSGISFDFHWEVLNLLLN